MREKASMKILAISTNITELTSIFEFVSSISNSRVNEKISHKDVVENIVQIIKGWAHIIGAHKTQTRKGNAVEKNAIKTDLFKFLKIPSILTSSHAGNIRYISQNSAKKVIMLLSRGMILKNDFHSIIQKIISVTITGTRIYFAMTGIKVINENITSKLLSISSIILF